MNTVEDAVLVMKLPGVQDLGEGGQVIEKVRVRPGGCQAVQFPNHTRPGQDHLNLGWSRRVGGWGWGHLNLGWPAARITQLSFSLYRPSQSSPRAS